MTRFGAAVIAALLATAAPAQSDLVLSPAEARDLAASVLAAGQPADAVSIARGLLLRDPDDVSAHLLIAQASIVLLDFDTALEAASRAYALSANTDARFQAAQMVAVAHSQLGHPTRAQIWLRRARVETTETDAIEGLAEDYRYLRNRNPLTLNFGLDIMPSSNVNNGTSSSTITTETPWGVLEGPVSPEGRALSGYTAGGSFNMSYRLSGDRSQRTSLLFAGSYTRTYFSEAAKQAAPSADPRDYDQAQVNIGIQHIRAAQNGSWVLRGAVGKNWYGGDALAQSASVMAMRQIGLASGDFLSVTGTADYNLYDFDDKSAFAYGLRTSWTHAVTGGDLTLNAGLRRSDSEPGSRNYASASVGASFALADPVAGMDLSFGVDQDWRDYTGTPREDARTTLTVTAGLPNLDLYGFHPVVTVEASRNRSTQDIQRSENFGIGFGIESAF